MQVQVEEIWCRWRRGGAGGEEGGGAGGGEGRGAGGEGGGCGGREGNRIYMDILSSQKQQNCTAPGMGNTKPCPRTAVSTSRRKPADCCCC